MYLEMVNKVINGGIVVWIIVAVVYFLPAIIAVARNHVYKVEIFFATLALTFSTGIGWLFCLVWASFLDGPEEI